MLPNTNISVVIITLNEAGNIADCLRSARMLTEDIIVVDSGSTDGTARLAALCGAHVLQHEWKGYGHARNLGAAAARNPWILALDADERLSTDLVRELNQVRLQQGIVYRFPRRNHWEERPIRFGTLGFERIARLYHRGDAHWNDFAVHERLTGIFTMLHLQGCIVHYGIQDPARYAEKKAHYAWLCALTYARQGKAAGLLQRIGAPIFNAFKSFVLLGGFLDGARGWQTAAAIFSYTLRKYRLLHQHRATLLAPVPAEQSVSSAYTLARFDP
ncbi:MAG: glycosyltransferase family 2 protein, partial [Chitinophagaceae bacterium]